MKKDSKKVKAGAGLGAAAAAATTAAAVVTNKENGIAEDPILAENSDAEEGVLVEEPVSQDEAVLVAENATVVKEPEASLDDASEVAQVAGHEVPVHEVLVQETYEEVAQAEPVYVAEETHVADEPVAVATPVSPSNEVATAEIVPEDDDFGGDFLDETDNTYLDGSDDFIAKRGEGDEDESFLSEIIEDIKEDIHNLF